MAAFTCDVVTSVTITAASAIAIFASLAYLKTKTLSETVSLYKYSLTVGTHCSSHYRSVVWVWSRRCIGHHVVSAWRRQHMTGGRLKHTLVYSRYAHASWHHHIHAVVHVGPADVSLEVGLVLGQRHDSHLQIFAHLEVGHG